MKLSAILLVSLLSGGDALENEGGLRKTIVEDKHEDSAHLDLELTIGGERQLFPLMPGTRCPTGHTCQTRTQLTAGTGQSPMINAIKRNIGTDLSMSLDWVDMNSQLETVVMSDKFCTRRNAMAKAAGLAAGLSMAAVSQPAFAAATTEVQMGADSGLLVFVPAKVTVCKGDTVKWINNKAGPHNVVFDEDNIPSGVDQEKISMDDQLGEPGDSFSMKFDTAGTYGYYCEPHRGAGMQATMIVQ